MSNLVPEGWTEEYFTEFADINPKLKFSAPMTHGLKVSFIKMEDVSNNAQVTRMHIRDYSEVAKGFTKFNDHDVLVAKITPCFENGKGGYVDNLTNGIGFGSTEFHVFRSRDNSDSRYLYHYTNYPTFRLAAEASMCGTGGQRRVQTEFLKTYKPMFPPLPEQQKIAAILTSVDEVLEKTQAQIDKLKDLKTAMMQDLLTNGVGTKQGTVDGEGYIPHTEFKDSPVGRIPKGWDCSLLDNVAKRGSGHTPNKLKPEYWNDGVKWVSLTDSSKLDRLYINDSAKKISQLGIENSSATMHPIGTVVMARDAGIGKSAIMTSSMAVSQHFMAWVCGERLNNYFLYYLLQLWKPKFEAIAMGSTIKTIGLPYFKKLQIPVPPMEEQQLITDSLKSVDEKVFVLQRKKVSLVDTKKALMQDLLTGKVRVKLGSCK